MQNQVNMNSESQIIIPAGGMVNLSDLVHNASTGSPLSLLFSLYLSLPLVHIVLSLSRSPSISLYHWHIKSFLAHSPSISL